MSIKASDFIVGSWMSPGWKFRMDISKDGDIYKGILAEGLENGELDNANINPALRSRKLLGSCLFEGLRFSGGQYFCGGHLYNPENGKKYSMNVSLLSKNQLKLRAFIGVPMLGISQNWERLHNRSDFNSSSIASEAGLKPSMVWDREKSQQYYFNRPWPVGCNFIPSSACNQLEMWQNDTFDPSTIKRELSMAKSIGFNTLRVFLHDLPFASDRQAFLNRIRSYLDIADSFGMSTLFVFFDDCWNDNPSSGRQKKPIPGVHNSRWVRSPGSKVINDEKGWSNIEDYVKTVISSFKDDKRVYGWDLYNEIGNSAGFLPNSTKLLAKSFLWAREVAPSQPLTACIWNNSSWYKGINKFIAENSDIVSFHNYAVPEVMNRRIDELSAYGRPIICSEYMARTQGSTFSANLPIMKRRGVGAISWGLVSGKTQTIFPWGSRKGSKEPTAWFHDIFRKDGAPFDVRETGFLRSELARENK